jgi:hypothetical protein
VDAAVRELGKSFDDPGRESEPPDRRPAMRRTGFVLAVDAGARADVTFAGTMSSVYADNPESGAYGGFVIPALLTRHPFVSTRERRDSRYEFAYALFPIRSWAGAPLVDVTVRHPRAWDWSAEGVAWTRSQKGREAIEHARVDPRALATLRFSFVVAGTPLLDGGPLLGIGGRLDAQELRTRIGWEAGMPGGSLLFSAAVETNFHSRATIVPLVEGALPFLIFIPSIGLGAGVPVQLRADQNTQVGGRLLFTLSLPFLSLLIPLDFYPAAPSGDGFQTSMLGQVSF